MELSLHDWFGSLPPACHLNAQDGLDLKHGSEAESIRSFQILALRPGQLHSKVWMAAQLLNVGVVEAALSFGAHHDVQSAPFPHVF
mmetsp:Transcript_57888/g.102862  ORF Transcript_57888/g.102862 Transcript_57888/m.102862 type:complete len:86 (+) Transcript_57888:2429-2686(+)